MKLIDIVEILQTEGHRIQYRHRTDGGLIITSIDGKKFSSLTEGNKTARSMVVGGELSFARAQQVAFNVKKYIKLDTEFNRQTKKAKGQIDVDLVKQLKKVQRLWRENNIQSGKITKKTLRAYMKYEGKKKAMEYLISRERYARGLVNAENFEHLMERMKRLERVSKKYANDVNQLRQDMKFLYDTDSFYEKWIKPIMDVIGVSEGRVIPAEEVPSIIRQIRDIIGM